MDILGYCENSNNERGQSKPMDFVGAEEYNKDFRKQLQ